MSATFTLRQYQSLAARVGGDVIVAEFCGRHKKGQAAVILKPLIPGNDFVLSRAWCVDGGDPETSRWELENRKG